MKKFLGFGIGFYTALSLFAAEVANFDFTVAKVKNSEKYGSPQLKDVIVNDDSLIFDGDKSAVKINAKDFHLLKGGAVVIRVKLDLDKDKKNHQMLALKGEEWWLACEGGKRLYFNFIQGNNQAISHIRIPFDFSKISTIGISVSDDDTYVICADGKVLKSGVLTINDSPCYNDLPITLGNGWGGWAMKGNYYSIRLFDQPLTKEQLIQETKK